MSYLIKFSSFIITLILVLTSLALASSPPTFTKVNETGIALYNEFVLGEDTEEIAYRILNDTTWLVTGPGISLYPQIEDGIPIMPFQIQYNNLDNCKNIISQLPEPLDSSIDSGYIYLVSVNMLPILDRLSCIEKIVACNDTIFSMDLRKIPGYKLSFIEDYENDSIKFKLATNKCYSNKCYNIISKPVINSSHDSVIVNLSVVYKKVRGTITEWDWGLYHDSNDWESFAFGKFSIPMAMNDYQLIIIDNLDTAVINVQKNDAYISFIPQKKSIIKLDKWLYKLQPKNIYNIRLFRWSESGWRDFADELIHEVEKLGAEYFILESGTYSSFTVTVDSVNHIIVKDQIMCGSKPTPGKYPAFFFKYSGNEDDIKEIHKSVTDKWQKEKRRKEILKFKKRREKNQTPSTQP